MRRRWIMHVDMDAFYASVEQRDHPQWRGLPVIVGASERRGVVATASYEARAYGVHSAMAGSIARQRCPQGIFVRPRMHVYREVSALIHEVLYRYAPEIEPLSLDEAFLDISGMGTQFPTLKALGRSVQRDIYDAVGLSASVGIGGNKFLAKLASDLEKPHGLVIIPYEQAQEMIAPLPVRRLWGVGPKLEAELETLGYVTIADVAAADPDQLARQIGQRGKRSGNWRMLATIVRLSRTRRANRSGKRKRSRGISMRMRIFAVTFCRRVIPSRAVYAKKDWSPARSR